MFSFVKLGLKGDCEQACLRCGLYCIGFDVRDSIVGLADGGIQDPSNKP